jgi:hypothetical protein
MTPGMAPTVTIPAGPTSPLWVSTSAEPPNQPNDAESVAVPHRLRRAQWTVVDREQIAHYQRIRRAFATGTRAIRMAPSCPLLASHALLLALGLGRLVLQA